jgi:hypothetical protein
MDFAFVGNVGGGHRRQAILEQATASFRGSAVAAPPEESPDIYGAARVGLNIAGNEAALDINMRTFEIPACRTAMLTDGDPVALAQLYRPNEEAVTFSGVADCMAKLEMLLSSPRRCEELAEAGYRRTLSDHTYSHRAARIVDVALATGVTRGRRSFGAQAIVRFWQSRPGVRIQGGLSLKRRVPSDGI